jgi:hypothetical protein
MKLFAQRCFSDFADLMETVEKTLCKREVLKLLLRQIDAVTRQADVVSIPCLRKPGTKEVRTLNVQTRELQIRNVQRCLDTNTITTR